MEYLIMGFFMSIGWQLAKTLMYLIAEGTKRFGIKLQKKADEMEKELNSNNVSDNKRSTIKMKIGF